MSAPTVAATEAVGRALKTLLATSRRLKGRETHRPGRLSFAQYGLLFSLAEAGELSASELARNADVQPATVTQMLDNLEASGLVTRRRDEDDRRVVRTSLTPQGAAVVEERRTKMEPKWNAALADFDDDELRTAAAVMSRLSEFFDGLQGEG